MFSDNFTMFMALVGIGMLSGFVFPCLNGPFNSFKTLRERIGKPFSCPTCSFLWGIIIPSLFVSYVPIVFYLIFGSMGWGLTVMHIIGYNPMYQGMEDS